MFAESTAKRLIPTAVAVQFHKNSSIALFLWNSAIVTMRISAGVPRRSGGRCKVFRRFRLKTLHLNKASLPWNHWFPRRSALFTTHYNTPKQFTLRVEKRRLPWQAVRQEVSV